MKSWLHGRATWLIAFLAITALVLGGLGWVTGAVLRLEREQADGRAEAERFALLRPAMWQLESRIAPVLAREDSRPYNQYSAVFAPPALFRNDGTPIAPGTIVEPSPLLNEELPVWMRLHFQTDVEQGWGSPQVLSQTLCKILENPKAKAPLDNVTEARDRLRLQIAGCFNPNELVQCVKERSDQRRWVDQTLLIEQQIAVQTHNPLANANPGNYNEDQQKAATLNVQPQQTANQGSGRFSNVGKETNAFLERAYSQELSKREMGQTKQLQQEDQSNAWQNSIRNGEGWFVRNAPKAAVAALQKTPAVIKVGAMVSFWVTPDDGEERLLVARLVEIGDKQVVQGIVLDWEKLQDVLTDVVKDSFPAAQFVPMRKPRPEHPERTMTALPVEMDPGPIETAEMEAWTPLRLGLAFSWVAALVALTAVGLGGRSLIDLSERRIRFVSAVTHELRTPLTTLRLYLDMLTGGLVKDEARQAEYLATLHGETDRLHRLVGNVLDFSRLERQRPKLELTTVPVPELIEQVQSSWQGRCTSVEKELVSETPGVEAIQVKTDVNLVQQILGNLIDNACKYSRGADDKRIWLRARRESNRLVFEVEDRGPGVSACDRRSIFQPFRRGQHADETAGGVGLGLALSRQWAALLGGQLTLATGAGGACFRLELPA